MKRYTLVPGEGGRPFSRLGGTPALFDASKEELAVLLCLLEAGGAGEEDIPALSRAAGCSPARTASALRYFAACGILSVGEGEKGPAKKIPARPKELLAETPPTLSGKEIARVVEEEELSSFLDSMQQLCGRLFNTKELDMLVGLFADLPFTPAYLLMLAAYCKKKSGRARFSLRYMSTVAYTLLEEEVLSEEALAAYIEREDKFSSLEWQLRKLLGIGERRLGKKEKSMMLTWSGQYNYGMNVIGIAYDITVDRTGKAALPYMHSLLSAFYGAGCRTEADVEAYLEKERAEHEAKKLLKGRTKKKSEGEGGFKTGKSETDPTATRGSSFSGEDYMSAALRRSYGED